MTLCTPNVPLAALSGALVHLEVRPCAQRLGGGPVWATYWEIHRRAEANLATQTHSPEA